MSALDLDWLVWLPEWRPDSPDDVPDDPASFWGLVGVARYESRLGVEPAQAS